MTTLSQQKRLQIILWLMFCQSIHCGSFDTTFTLVAYLYNNVTCYSDENYENIEFSRATGGGGSLPPGAKTSIRQNAAVLDLTGVDFGKRDGVYKCEMKVDNTSAEISVPMTFGVFHFQVAYIGDTVQFEEVGTLHEGQLSFIRWRHNGVPVPSWDGQTKVEIRNVQLADAGMYDCSYKSDLPGIRQTSTKLIVRKCGRDLFGENCDLKCPPCYNGGICHDVFGICLCPAGFTGDNCEIACGKYRSGSDCKKVCSNNDCRNTLFCQPDPYGCSCISGLRGRYFHEYLPCYDTCEPGWYGADCKQPCHCAGGPTSCDRYTGACSSGGCSPGWTGRSCEIKVAN